MKKIKIALFCSAVALLPLAGYFFYPKAEHDVPEPTFKTYKSEKFGFSVNYPKTASNITDSLTYDLTGEKKNAVSFSNSDGEIVFRIYIEDTSFNSTEDWVKAQPKGNTNHLGLEPVFWLDGKENVLANEYIVVDHDNKKPIYGKYPWFFTIRNHKLFKISNYQQLRPEDIPAVSQETLDIVSSFSTK